MERLADDTIESFMNAIEERLAEGQKNKIPFSRFLDRQSEPGFGVPCHLPEISMLHLEWHFR